MLDDAHFYRDLGFSQLPLDGKRPAIPRWKHLIRRFPTEAEIRSWFQNTRNNIGIICGQISGIVVLDADTQELADSLARQLPPTAMMTKTARGRHFFYRLKKGQHVPPRVRINHLMLDVRGEASYAAAAHSIHPETGQPYQRLGSWKLREVPYFDPAWIPAASPESPLSRGNVKSPLSYISQIRAVSGAGGSNATFRAACILRDAGFSEAETLAAMIEWNQTNAEPPWSVRELLHKVQDVFSRVPGKGEFR